MTCPPRCSTCCVNRSRSLPKAASEKERETRRCQDLAPKGRDVTVLCEEGLVKGTFTSQSERRTFTFHSEPGGSFCNPRAYLLHDERGRRAGMPVCAC